MPVKTMQKFSRIGLAVITAVFLLTMLALSAQLTGPVYAGKVTGTPRATADIPRSDNLLYNGNFEYGYYPVGELGFEPPDIGNIPHKWSWFKSNTYGKYDIDNNEGFGIICPEDSILKSRSKNSLSIYIQSTDQPDARLGVYQTVDVVPGQDYLFAISGTIQIQNGASSPDINHHLQLAFDHTGGANWQAIPFEEWTLLPWREQELEWKVSGPSDPDLAKIENYYTLVKARSNKMTVFIGAWRRWANWRTAIFTLDCASLIPLHKVSNFPAIIPQLSDLSTTSTDQALAAAIIQTQPDTTTVQMITTTNQSVVNPSTETSASAPASSPGGASSQPAATAAPHPAEIPDSGGIVEGKDNTLLIIAVAVVVIAGLAGAGLWNMWRQKR